MITNFKIFENVNLKYKVNDYVCVVGYPDMSDCQIVLVNKKLNNRSWDYMVETYNIKNNFWKYYIDEDDIERKMTPDEINNYEIKKNAIKYNI